MIQSLAYVKSGYFTFWSTNFCTNLNDQKKKSSCICCFCQKERSSYETTLYQEKNSFLLQKCKENRHGKRVSISPF